MTMTLEYGQPVDVSIYAEAYVYGTLPESYCSAYNCAWLSPTGEIEAWRMHSDKGFYAGQYAVGYARLTVEKMQVGCQHRPGMPTEAQIEALERLSDLLAVPLFYVSTDL